MKNNGKKKAPEGPKIVAVGGGTGLSVLLHGLKTVSDRLTAVVTMADDGGGSGILREDLGMLPPGDIRSCISALAEEEGLMQALLRYRFSEGMLAGQSFGNLLIAALNDITGSFEEAVATTSDILRVSGRVLPVTADNVYLSALLENGDRIFGESSIPQAVINCGSPIASVALEPRHADPNPQALAAIAEADLIVLGPGSLFTSIIPNLLVAGMSEALRKAPGRKAFICNVMTQPGETDGYGLREHVEAMEHYLGENALSFVVANTHELDPLEKSRYVIDGARQVLPSEEDVLWLEQKGIRLINDDYTDLKAGYIRHNAEKIARDLAGLLEKE